MKEKELSRRDFIKGSTVAVTGAVILGLTECRKAYAVSDTEQTAANNGNEAETSSSLIPAYFSENLRSAVRKVREIMLGIGREGDAFVFITDCHWHNNEKHSPALIRYILKNTSVKMVVNGGDYLWGHRDTKQSAVNEIYACVKSLEFHESGCRTFNVIGNHDHNTNNNQDKSTYLTAIEAYSLTQKENENNDISYGGYNYYYWDNRAAQIRYVFFDRRAGAKPEEKTWLEEVMGTLPAGYSVICFIHGIYQAKKTDDGYIFAMEQQAVLDMFEPFKGKIICFVQGHAHMDGVFYAYNEQTEVPIIVTDCDCKNPVMTGVTATVGTITEQCFDIMIVNRTKRLIHCIRVGRGADREISF